VQLASSKMAAGFIDNQAESGFHYSWNYSWRIGNSTL